MDRMAMLAELTSLLIMGLLFWFLPIWKGPDAFFGVPVSEDFIRSRRARGLLRGYRGLLLFLYVPVLASLGIPSWAEMGAVLMGAACVGPLVAVVVGYRLVRPYEVEAPQSVQTASLAPRWTWQYLNGPLELVCLALLGLTLAALWVRPDPDPRQAQGVAMMVFSQIYLFVLMVAFLPGIAQARMWLPAEETEEFLRRREQYMGTLVGLLYFLKITVMLQLCVVAWSVGGGPALVGLTWVLQGVMGGGLAWFCVRLFRQRRQLRALAGPGSLERAAPSEGWIGGMIYYNRQDPSLVVEKRIGIGWTFNFAHPITWLWMALLIAGPLLAAWLIQR